MINASNIFTETKKIFKLPVHSKESLLFMLAKKRIRKKKSLKNVVVSTKMTVAEIKALRLYAAKQGVSFAAVVRSFIRATIVLQYKHIAAGYRRTNRNALSKMQLRSLLK